MKSIILGLVIMIVGASPVCAASCNGLRSALADIDRKINSVNELMNADVVGSAQMGLDIEIGKRAILEYIDMAKLFFAQKCIDNGRVAASVRIFTTVLDTLTK